jgi:hypothetical protein
MANTTNYNWETPDDTDLVKDGAAAIRTLGSSVDTTTKALNPSTTLGDIEYRSATANTNTRLAIGTTGQVLSVVGGVPAWATSDDANAIQNAIVDAKGDIIAASANDTPARLAVGTDNHRLVAASGETTGLKYVADTVNTVIDAEGDLLVGDAADAVQRLAIGTTGQVLTVDTAVDGKIKWAAASGGGKVLQVVSATTTTSTNITSTSYTDTTITATITPTSATSKILVLISAQYLAYGTGATTVVQTKAQLLRGATQILENLIANQIEGASSNPMYVGSSMAISYYDNPSTTSATTYKLQAARILGTGIYYQGSNSNASTITLLEIGA